MSCCFNTGEVDVVSVQGSNTGFSKGGHFNPDKDIVLALESMRPREIKVQPGTADKACTGLTASKRTATVHCDQNFRHIHGVLQGAHTL